MTLLAADTTENRKVYDHTDEDAWEEIDNS